MAAAVKEKSSRQTTTSREQYEIYITFLECNKEMATKKDCDNTVQTLWQELTNLLNSGAGPKRTTQCWKKIFENWRNAIRHKSRKLLTHLNGTGGGPESKEKLKSLEERALNVWGKIVVTGIGNVEAGFVDVAPDTPPVNIPTNSGEAAELTRDVPQVAPRKPLKRKSNNDDELLKRLAELEAKQAEGYSEIAEGLHSIADAINNLAEVVHMLKKN